MTSLFSSTNSHASLTYPPYTYIYVDMHGVFRLIKFPVKKLYFFFWLSVALKPKADIKNRSKPSIIEMHRLGI